MLMGEDLEWSNAEKVFYSIDRLIKDINGMNVGVKFRYSTVDDYAMAAKAAKEDKLNTLKKN